MEEAHDLSGIAAVPMMGTYAVVDCWRGFPCRTTRLTGAERSNVGTEYMMKTALIALLTCSMTMPVAAQPQRRSTKVAAPIAVEPAVCKSLMDQYEGASKKLALSQAEDSTDNSAARSTMREAQNGNVINQAKMTMDLMKSTGCKPPTFIPSASRYSLASLHCVAALKHIQAQEAVDRLDDKISDYPYPVECNTESWKPSDQ